MLQVLVLLVSQVIVVELVGLKDQVALRHWHGAQLEGVLVLELKNLHGLLLLVDFDLVAKYLVILLHSQPRISADGELR